jgi:hypothetical protein
MEDQGGWETDEDSDGFELGSGGVTFTLREIPFYDDEVDIFRARHARL